MARMIGWMLAARSRRRAWPARRSAARRHCPVKIGGILPLTGSMGPVAKHIAESAQLARSTTSTRAAA